MNNLFIGTRQLTGGLTYRQRHRWISELDLCLVSRGLADAISSLHVEQQLCFPSDHAPVTPTINVSEVRPADMNDLTVCASQLGDHAVLHSDPIVGNSKPQRKRPVKKNQVDEGLFQRELDQCSMKGLIVGAENHEEAIANFCDMLYSCAASSQNVRPTNSDRLNDNVDSVAGDRWQRILASRDDKLLWKSINWKGEIYEAATICPSGEEFKNHLEALTNPEDALTLSPEDYATVMNVPMLDDPFDPDEVVQVIDKQVKPNKSAGPDGLSPALFKLLPVQWVITLTILLNAVFTNGYPKMWAYARLMMLFKKGDRLNCDNYRGVSIINSISKIYDYILCNRLTKWFSPEREQAGAQPGRGCLEHIVTLRLIMNYCFKKRVKLFVAYVDLSKAYDRVPRNKLMMCLKKAGCASAMLMALVAMYQVTRSMLGMAVITATIGVRQGSPTSGIPNVMFFVYTLLKCFN